MLQFLCFLVFYPFVPFFWILVIDLFFNVFYFFIYLFFFPFFVEGKNGKFQSDTTYSFFQRYSLHVSDYVTNPSSGLCTRQTARITLEQLFFVQRRLVVWYRRFGPIFKTLYDLTYIVF